MKEVDRKPFSMVTLLLLISVQKISFARDTISPTQPLKDGDTIVSLGGIFEMGFFRPINSQNRYVGIWYKQIPVQTVVWVANRDTPLTNTSSVVLKIINPGRLALVDGNSSNIWYADTSRLVRNPIAKLLDSGNLVVTDANNDNPEDFVWQSFDHPTDTHLPGMKLGKNFIKDLDVTISSWRTENDPGMGKFKLFLDPTGYPQIIIRIGRKKVYGSGPWNGLRWSGSGALQKRGKIAEVSMNISTNEVSTSYKVYDSSNLIRMVLTSSGIAEIYIWADGTVAWESILKTPTDVCDNYGECGAYGSCDYKNYPVCGCLDKFLPRDPVAWGRADFTGGCARRTPLNCQNGSSNGFLKYSGIKLPDTEFSMSNSSMNLQECEQFCLNNCSCTAYSSLDISNGENGCLLWFRELVDIRVVPLNGQNLFIRMASSDIVYASSSKGKKSKIIKLSASVLIGMLLLSLTLTLILIFYKRKRKKTELKFEWEEVQTLFEVSAVTRATDNFSLKNKIGEGGYGPVYKGVLDDGKEIAVKRLSKTSLQGLQEFKNEVNFIAKLQHRNLVKLLGWCIQGEEKMLIYEYMPNKSLDSFIFDHTRTLLDWSTRLYIINGIARGLMYLHQDSRLRIIHRDLKASNILLDIDMNPKISDFGLAKRIGLNEIGENTINVAGTHGYMSPEYAGHGIFSIKSDVFSFGVLVLEIVSGKRNRGFSHHQDHYENLLGHAWKLYRDGRSIELVDGHLHEAYDLPQVLRSIHIGLLCVQHCPEDRPSMSSIVHMLANDVELPIAKEPGFFIERRVAEAKSSSGTEMSCSINEVTISLLNPR